MKTTVKLVILFTLMLPTVVQAHTVLLAIKGLTLASKCEKAISCYDLSISKVGRVVFLIQSDAVVGRTRLTAVHGIEQQAVSTIQTTLSTNTNEASSLEISAEDVCIGAAQIGCGEWMVGKSAFYRIGFDVDADRMLSNTDDFTEIAINFVP